MRKFTGAFVLAALMASMLTVAQPAWADTGAPGGPNRSTCAFLSGIVMKIPNADLAAVAAAIFNNLFGCSL
jgi:hypothetical protein